MKSPMQKPIPVIINSGDIQNIMGCSIATARRLMRKIRREYNKPPYSFITIPEFCMCTGIEEAFVREYLS